MSKNKFIEGNDQSINLLDVMRYLASYWKWYVLSIAVFTGYFFYEYSKTAFVYSRSVTIMIRNSENTPETVRLRRNSNMSFRSDGAGEIMLFRSKELMRSAVSRIHADVSYTVKEGLRCKELYTSSPVQVSFLDAAPSQSFEMYITPAGAQCVEVIGGEWKQPIRIILNDTTDTPVGRIIITARENYTNASQSSPIRVTKLNRESVVNYYLSNLSVFQPESSVAVLQFTLRDKSASRASDMLYTLINTFNEKSIEEKNRVAVNMGKFIQERLSIIENDLGNVESDIEAIKEKNAGLDISTAAGLYISESREYRAVNKELESQMQMVNYMRQYLENETEITSLIPNSTGLKNAEIEKQITQYNNAVLKRNRLAEGNNRNNPIVREVDKSLAQMRDNLLVAVESLSNGLEMIKEKNSKEESITRDKIRTIPVKEREALSVERQQKVKEDLYIYLLNKREENALNGAMTDSNARIIDSPSGSERPISPVRLKKIVLGAGCGMFFPTLILLLLLKFDTRVRSRKDIEREVSAPFLGSIPLVKLQKGAFPIVIERGDRSAVSESFRLLRSNLDFISGKPQRGKVVTSVSFNPGAGKTFVTINLGVCLALGNKNVILLDMDLRKATLSSHTHMRRLAGISNYLSDDSVQISDLIQHNINGSGVDLIPAGAIPPNPSELLMSERLDKLISELKMMYDYILIDNVPVGMVADSAIVNRVSDMTLFVVRSGNLERGKLSELERLYSEDKLNHMAVVLNGVTRQEEYGYGYGYGYKEKALDTDFDA